MTSPRTEVRVDGVSIELPDGRKLYTARRWTWHDRWVETNIGRINMGYVHVGLAFEWVRMPDGTERRADHQAILMRLSTQTQQKRPSALQRLLNLFKTP